MRIVGRVGKTCTLCGGAFKAAAQGRRCPECKAKIKDIWKDLVRGAYKDAIEIAEKDFLRRKSA